MNTQHPQKATEVPQISYGGPETCNTFAGKKVLKINDICKLFGVFDVFYSVLLRLWILSECVPSHSFSSRNLREI